MKSYEIKTHYYLQYLFPYHHTKALNVWVTVCVNSKEILLEDKRKRNQFDRTDFPNSLTKHWCIESTKVYNNDNQYLYAKKDDITTGQCQMPA